jgi:signal peptidase II
LIVLVLIIFVFSFWKISFGNTKKTSWVINRVGLIGFILILSGGLGNLVDRIFYGYVIDFIRVGGWPNFNLADSYITIGVILIIISLFSKDYHIQKE